ncbi:MAG TPA: CARDB domain-containing protein [Pyrinomonadaceae bacterium]
MKKERKALSLAMLVASFLVLNLILQPVSQAQRVAGSAQGSTQSIVSGRISSPVLAPPALPDLVAQKGLKIGNGGGRFVPWGGSINLSRVDSVVAGDKCTFNVTYDMTNSGTAISIPFKNALKLGSTEVSILPVQSLAAGATLQVTQTPYLTSGTYILSLSLDSTNVVAESNEANNTNYLTVRVNCGTLPDITSPKGITFGGNAVTGAGGRFVPWDGSITLSRADAVQPYRDGCMFYVHYDMQNLSAVATSPVFANRLLSGLSPVGIFMGQSIPAGQTVHVTKQVYLWNGSHDLSLELDWGHVVNESNEANNLYKVKAKVNCH